ncbi:MAG TPA: hypothetical protein VM370_01715 [Candidatus Thermoplasmatota archaeon]|nr:hypothetical protein [Candidatus Thermoplasmatota archaeon]
MLAIAVAILVGIPIAFALADNGIPDVDGGEIVNFGLGEAATVTDLALIQPPGEYFTNDSMLRPEQLVEGHTVFLTMDIVLEKRVKNFTQELVGNVTCEFHEQGSGEFFGGIVPVPSHFDELHEECHAAGMGFVTPDPFIDSDDQTLIGATLTPTGNTPTVTAPNGEETQVTEYSYDITTENWLGEQQTRHLYAWSAPVLDPWTHSDGRTMNWYCPIPEERLVEMGLRHFRVLHESEMSEFTFA